MYGVQGNNNVRSSGLISCTFASQNTPPPPPRKKGGRIFSNLNVLYVEQNQAKKKKKSRLPLSFLIVMIYFSDVQIFFVIIIMDFCLTSSGFCSSLWRRCSIHAPIAFLPLFLHVQCQNGLADRCDGDELGRSCLTRRQPEN